MDKGDDTKRAPIRAGLLAAPLAATPALAADRTAVPDTHAVLAEADISTVRRPSGPCNRRSWR